MLDLITRWGWVASVMPWPHCIPREVTPGTHWIGGWVGLGTGLDAEVRGKILCLCWGSNPSRPLCSQTPSASECILFYRCMYYGGSLHIYISVFHLLTRVGYCSLPFYQLQKLFHFWFSTMAMKILVSSLLSENKRRVIKSPVCLSVCVCVCVCVPLITFESLGRFSWYLVGR
jgi:hypothetical protein